MKPQLEELTKAKADWDTHHSLPFAGDFIGAAFALGQSSVAKPAAEFILNSDRPASKAARDLAHMIIADRSRAQTLLPDPPLQSIESTRQNIRLLRKVLQEFPRNPLAYLDLAREYVALGQPLHALKPMQMALSLAPSNRFVLRSASRFFLHYDDAEQAHDLLRRASNVKEDPWLLAAEIAVASAAGRTSKLIKTGRHCIESHKFHPSHISELAGALGTLDWEAGNIRSVKKLFRKALEKPTENSVAQAAWLSRRSDNIGVDPSLLQVPRSFEARAWSAIGESQWDESLKAAQLWLADEPFAKRAAVFGSWVALLSTSGAEEGESIARYGLRMHPSDFLLLNNLTVALAYQGKIDEACDSFEKIVLPENNSAYKPTYLATKGLLRFRSGAPEEGRSLYQMAIIEARNRKDLRSVVRALLHLAREERRQDPKTAEALVSEGSKDTDKLAPLEQIISMRLIELAK
ncbi:MAG: hypothetical protein RI101_12035 [Nitrospira sp.]|nr:hypothetical protein [Nitrospira sp.]